MLEEDSSVNIFGREYLEQAEFVEVKQLQWPYAMINRLDREMTSGKSDFWRGA
jgi:hypothetical protein